MAFMSRTETGRRGLLVLLSVDRGWEVGVFVPWKRPPKEKKRVAIFVIGFGWRFHEDGDRSSLEQSCCVWVCES